MFEVGDTVVHPSYGAGKVINIRELHTLGRDGKQYYSIRLLSQPETTVMVPLDDEQKAGLRLPMNRARLERLWRILSDDPNELPSDYKKRYAMLKAKVETGDMLEIARVLRDLAWRREERRKLTTRGKRLYETGMELLASEVAGAQGRDYDAAQAEISAQLADTVARLSA
jgi:CarD family transcriptional regulator